MERKLQQPLVFFFFFFCLLYKSNRFCDACKVEERQALLTFKQSLNDNCNLLSNWNGSDCCQWRGVGCSEKTNEVIKLDIGSLLDSNFGICGFSSDYWDRSLLTLKNLQHLDLSNFVFHSDIPQFLGSITSLRYLNLSGAAASGRIPSSCANLTNLQYLDLSKSYRGLISDSLHWLVHLSSLQYLDMSNANLSRAVDWPLVFNRLPSLSVLKLSDCDLASSDLHTSVSSSITTIDLSRNSFADETKLYELVLNLGNGLVNIDLSSCSLHGEIPHSLGSLTSLKILDLSFNDFNGPLPENFNNLSQLEFLDLRGNSLHGLLPEILTNLCNLGTLLLSGNNFVGNLSSMVNVRSARCKKYSLEVLDLSFNQLTGSLPDWIAQMRNLTTLDLSYNSLHDTVSDTIFANLRELKELHLSGNRLIFNTSSTWIPPFQLDTIDLRSCRMGARFPPWLRTQNGFDYLDISGAGIVDVIPDWFWNASSKADYLNISFNRFRGEIPRSLKFLSAKIIDLSSNQFRGKLPYLNSGVLSLSIFLGENLFSGDVQSILNTEMLNLRDVVLSRNFLSGKIPSAVCNLTSMQFIDLSHNNLSGVIPNCDINSGSLPSLFVVNFADNYLQGSIPQWLAGPTVSTESNLKVLVLNKNSLSGEIPSFLQRCYDMVILDLGENRLTGEIPSWAGESLSSLRFLRLRSNMLTGTIPRQLSYITSLQVLDLAQNDLSGHIPPSFNNFTAMTKTNRTVEDIITYIDGASRLIEFEASKFEERVDVVVKGKNLEYTKTLSLVMVLDLSCNQFSSEMPIELMDLVGLQSLNLSRNRLTGKIPDKFSGMANIEALDFSSNHLSGEIPPSIASLSSLSYLNLSYNNLSGRIPSGNQLQTLTDASIYAGNHNLCGFPLPKCVGDGPSMAPVPEDDEDPDMFDLYLSMGIGYLVGLWGIFVLFLFKNSWRIAYFRFSDKMATKFFLAKRV